MKAVFAEWWNKQIGKLKSEKGKMNKAAVRDEWLNYIDSNIADLVDLAILAFQLFYKFLL